MRSISSFGSSLWPSTLLVACLLTTVSCHGDHSHSQIKHPQGSQQQQQPQQQQQQNGQQQQQQQQQQQKQHPHHSQQQQQQQQQQQEGHGHAGQTVPLHNAKHVQDKEHIKEHLKEQINVKEEQMSDKDLQFHYFKVHDSDNNDKLDGIELANAMAHYHDEETGEKSGEYSEEELAGMVDQILDEDDLNKDGYIDYPEFIQSQEREEETAE